MGWTLPLPVLPCQAENAERPSGEAEMGRSLCVDGETSADPCPERMLRDRSQEDPTSVRFQRLPDGGENPSMELAIGCEDAYGFAECPTQREVEWSAIDIGHLTSGLL